jgi:signal peptidase I
MKKLIVYLLLFTFLVGSFFLFFGFSSIAGTGMEPTINSGQKIVTQKYYFSPSTPKRGDVVLYEWDEGLLKAGRVVGLPLEEVRIQKGNVYIKTKKAYKLNEDYISKEVKTTSNSEGDWFKLGEYEYLILSDNRTEKPVDFYNSVVPAGKIKQKVIAHF